jgi:hypothetical protein
MVVDLSVEVADARSSSAHVHIIFVWYVPLLSTLIYFFYLALLRRRNTTVVVVVKFGT